MRVAATSNFMKLWGRIDETLPKGDYTITINNNFDVSGFDGKKAIILSNANFFGGENWFLGFSYIFVGVFSLTIMVYFII